MNVFFKKIYVGRSKSSIKMISVSKDTDLELDLRHFYIKDPGPDL